MNSSVGEFLNESVIENDVFEDMVEKQHHQREIEPLEKYFIISEFIEFISNLVNISAYLFLIIIILRYKKLQTRTNTYIIHLAILYLIFSAIKVILHTLGLDYDIELVFEQASISILILYMSIALILALDWFLSGYKPYWFSKYAGCYKYVLTVVYGIVLTEYLLTFVYTHMHHMIRKGVSLIFYITIIVILGILNLMKRFVTLDSKSAKTAYSFLICNIIIFSLIPVLIWHITLTFVLFKNYILICASIIFEIVWYNHPIIVVYVLGSLNKHFKMAYKKSFKQSVQGYDGDDFIEESEEEQADIRRPQEDVADKDHNIIQTVV